MTANMEDKKVVLLALSDTNRIKYFEDLIGKHLSRAKVFIATDAVAAINKIENAPPHLVITEYGLPKGGGDAFIEKILKKKTLDGVALLVTSLPPVKENYIDEIVTGRLQFVELESTESVFIQALMKGLNYASHGQASAEFFIRFLAKDDLLIKEGDKAEFIYFVKRGRLCAYKMKDGKPFVLGHIEVGEFVGEMAYINNEPRSASVVAEIECELIEVPLGTFEKVLYSRPSWSKALMTTLSKRLKVANENKVKNS